MVTPTSPGWYPNPGGKPDRRYWDGSGWSDRLPGTKAGSEASDYRAHFDSVNPTESSSPLPANRPNPVRSASAAGALQLFFGWLGLGRFYTGYVFIGSVQLILGLSGLLLMPMLSLGIVVLIPLTIWTTAEAILMFTGVIRDAQGRRLR